MRLFPFPRTAVAPIGTRKAEGFWDGHDDRGKPVGGYGTFEVNVYPESKRGEALRKARIAAGVSQRQLANISGLPPIELNALEHGRATTTDAGWKALRQFIKTLAGEE